MRTEPQELLSPRESLCAADRLGRARGDAINGVHAPINAQFRDKSDRPTSRNPSAPPPLSYFAA